jgi:AcrR family transcriptional regulator
VLKHVQEEGVDNFRVAGVADLLEVGVGTLYRRWGRREALLEHTWRTCVASVEQEVTFAVRWVTARSHQLAAVCERIEFGLPPELYAFFEIHGARRKWQRDLEPDGMVVPSLELYAEVNVRHGHFRHGPPRIIAGTSWWVMTGALSGPGRHDIWRKKWCVETLRRGLLSAQRLEAEDPIESLDLTVVEQEEPPSPFDD